MKKMKMRTLARNGRFFSAANTLRSHRRGGYYPPEHLRFFGIFEKGCSAKAASHCLRLSGVRGYQYPQLPASGTQRKSKMQTALT